MTDQEAVGIHQHDEYKLGRKPPKNAPALKLAPLLTGVVPTHPQNVDHFSEVDQWELGQNDRFGTCGPTSVANCLLDVTTYLAGMSIRVTDDDIFDLYRRSGNPNFDPRTDADDNGVDMQTMLEALLQGGISSQKPVAFAKVDESNLDEVRAAIAIFGGVLFGVNLEVAQQSQTNHKLWDYKQSAEWGGHAIYGGRYADIAGTLSDRIGVISWEEIIDTTDTFLQHQLDEVWVLIWPEHLGTKAFQEGVDAAQLAADYEALTGKILPVPNGPTPGPAPAPPQPAPSGLDLDQVSDALANALDQVTGEQPTEHKHRSSSKRRVLQTSDYIIEIHERA